MSTCSEWIFPDFLIAVTWYLSAKQGIDLISVGKTRHRLATMKYLFVVFDMYAGTCFVYPRLFGSHLSMNLLCWDIRLTEFRSSSNLRGFMFVTGLGWLNRSVAGLPVMFLAISRRIPDRVYLCGDLLVYYSIWGMILTVVLSILPKQYTCFFMGVYWWWVLFPLLIG